LPNCMSLPPPCPIDERLDRWGEPKPSFPFCCCPPDGPFCPPGLMITLPPSPQRKEKKRKGKTTLAETATISDSSAGISLEKVEPVQAQNSDPTGVQQQEWQATRTRVQAPPTH